MPAGELVAQVSVRPAWVLHWFARAVVPAMRDSAIAGLALWLALQLRFDFNVPQPFAGRWIWLVPVAAGMLLMVGVARGVYRTVPEFAGIIELLRLGEAVAVASVTALVAAKFALPDAHVVPLSVPLIAAMIMFLLLGLVRFGSRLTTHVKASWSRDGSGQRVIVVGAGQAGEMLVRDMLRTPGSDLRPVGFVDDDPAKKGKRIHGLPVLGATQDLVAVATRAGADLCLLAMPSAPSRALRETLGRVAAAGLKAKIIPGLGELVGSSVGVADIRDVDVADLIGREPVELDTESIAGFLERKTVLVTGAAGSIGSELARQLVKFRPAKLLLLDNNETDVFELHNDLRPVGARSDVDVHMIVCSVRDRRGIDAVFDRHRPHVVFHAAALKHVSVMEQHPDEAVLTNVTGTRHVAEAAIAAEAERFIFVSTDKAVNPTSVMGMTKRVAEMLIAGASETSSTLFASVRFGNVLGSRGSVVPIFKRQVQRGGPITVTHPDATRFFMTIQEAAALIIQAGAYAADGDVFVLDMGEPVKILDLAERIRELLAPLSSRAAIPIVFTGLREGEKLHEALFQVDEELLETSHPRIRRARRPLTQLSSEDLDTVELLAAARAGDGQIREGLVHLTQSEFGSRALRVATGD